MKVDDLQGGRHQPFYHSLFVKQPLRSFGYHSRSISNDITGSRTKQNAMWPKKISRRSSPELIRSHQISMRLRESTLKDTPRRMGCLCQLIQVHILKADFYWREPRYSDTDFFFFLSAPRVASTGSVSVAEPVVYETSRVRK